MRKARLFPARKVASLPLADFDPTDLLSPPPRSAMSKDPTRIFHRTALFLLFIFSPVSFVTGNGLFPQSNRVFVGDWIGELDQGGKKLKVVIHLVEIEDGRGLSGTLDSPAQGAFGLKLNPVRVEGNRLTFEFQPAGFMYSGEVSPDGLAISGTLTQRGGQAALVFSKASGNQPPSAKKQDPKPPFPYLFEEVTVVNPEDPRVILSGTLTIPKEGEGPFPAVVLISGSGPQNRDSEVFGHRPFFVLADFLTRMGVAVLRFDDRGVGKSKGDFASATTRDFASDVFALVQFLKTRKEIDSARIGLIGHSEGGYVAPMVAARTRDVSFLVLMAAPGVSGLRLSLAQGETLARAEGVSEGEIQKNRTLQMELFEIYLSEADPMKAEPRLIKAVERFTAPMTDEKKRVQETQRLLASAKAFNNGWFRFFLRYEPGPTLKKVRIPVLALNGSLDLQVHGPENLGAISRHLRSGGNRKVRINELPGLNHLFQTAKTGATSEYGLLDETISPSVLGLISDWISTTVKPRSKRRGH